MKEIDYTDRIDKLLNKKPKEGSLKEWSKEWDSLMKEFIGNEESKTKSTRKKGTKKKGQGKNVGAIPADMAGKT